MQEQHGCPAVPFATFCAVNDRDFRAGHAYINAIRQPERVASDF
jgi:hypothetical protein